MTPRPWSRRRVALAAACPALAATVSLTLFTILEPDGLLGHDYSMILAVHFFNLTLGTAAAVALVASAGRTWFWRVMLAASSAVAGLVCYLIAFSIARSIGKAAGVGW